MTAFAIRRTTALALTVGAVSILAQAPAAGAGVVVDLVNTNSGTINNALFETTTLQPTGTGVIKPFVRLQANGTEQGYNTSASSLPFDEKAGIWTHDLQLKDIGLTDKSGISYLTFLLDINESNGGSKNLLSLDDIKIYTSPTGSKNTTNLASLGTLRYNMDAGGDNTVQLDYNLNSGSGSGDMLLYVPLSLFASASPNDFVYFYSSFGGSNSSDAGFEEWATLTSTGPAPIPEPASLSLLGLAALGLVRRRRNA